MWYLYEWKIECGSKTNTKRYYATKTYPVYQPLAATVESST
jgi:hypothetical protein